MSATAHQERLMTILQGPHLSEKSHLAAERGQIVFKVRPDANKAEIKQAVESLFGKKVVSVNTCNYHGKKKRERRQDFGRTARWKKAIVKLKEGESIDLV